ncbi:MAG: PQQ-binding-like beta-propeller repeat protein, partial [Pirellulaceae bacterium]
EIDSSANFYKDKVLIGSQDATLYCLNAADGELAWKYEIADQIRCSPTIVGNRCFLAGCDGRLHIIDIDEGKPVADVLLDGPTGVTPAVLGDRVFFGTEGGVFFAIDWRKAEVVWKYADPESALPFRSSAAVTKGFVLVGGRNKQIQALNPDNGKQLWQFTTRGRVDSSPVIIGNRMYVGGSDGRIYGLDLKTGKPTWEYETGDGFVGSAAIASGRLVIASDEGTVYCFGEKK